MSSSGKESSSSSSPSTGTPGRGSHSGSPELPLPTAKLLLKVAVAFVVALGVWYLVRVPYSHVVLAGSSRLLALRAGAPKEFIESRDGDFHVVTRLASDGERKREAFDDVHYLHRNAIYFLTLALASPRALLRRRWKYLLAAAAALLASQILNGWLQALVILGASYHAQQAPFIGDTAMDFVGGLFSIWSTILAPLVPFLLYAPVLVMKTTPAARAASTGEGVVAVSRNARCPCGSGKRYRRCCGRRSGRSSR